METTQNDNDPNKCAVCEQPKYDDSAICSTCRTTLSKLTIPAWVKIFAACILAMTLLGAVRMPKFLIAAVHDARGKKAKKESRYLTAQREFEHVSFMFPDCLENNFRLIVCCAHNMDYKGMADAAKQVEGLRSEEVALVDEANEAIDQVSLYTPSDKLDTLLTKTGPIDTDNVSVLQAYIAMNPDDFFATYLLADYYYEQADWKTTDSITGEILRKHPGDVKALGLMAAIKREEHQYDSAIEYYNKMLDWNAELPEAFSGKARVELKRHHDADAKQFALQAYNIDSTNSTALEAVALVDYFDGKQNEANRLLRAMRRDNPHDSAIAERLNSVLDGSTQYRQ